MKPGGWRTSRETFELGARGGAAERDGPIVRAGVPRHVWVRSVRSEAFADRAIAARGRKMLGVAEREALRRLRSPAARLDFLAAHTLVRVMLAGILFRAPAEIRFRHGPDGRPELLDQPFPARVRFSLSHADGIALCAVAMDCCVGADVESLRNLGPDLPGLAATICSPPEKQWLLQTPVEERAVGLLTIWTLKEALVKANGHGHRAPIDRTTIFDSLNRSAAVGLDAGSEASRWRLASRRPTSHHVAAVATRTAARDPVIVNFRELWQQELLRIF